jgi:hypothetical protein
MPTVFSTFGEWLLAIPFACAIGGFFFAPTKEGRNVSFGLWLGLSLGFVLGITFQSDRRWATEVESQTTLVRVNWDDGIRQYCNRKDANSGFVCVTKIIPDNELENKRLEDEERHDSEPEREKSR